MRESFVYTMKHRAGLLRGLALAAALLPVFASAPVVADAQHEGHGSHGAKTASPKKTRKSAATPRRKARRPPRTARRRARAKSRANREPHSAERRPRARRA